MYIARLPLYIAHSSLYIGFVARMYIPVPQIYICTCVRNFLMLMNSYKPYLIYMALTEPWNGTYIT